MPSLLNTSGKDAMLDPETSTGNKISAMTAATPPDNGRFSSHDGVRLPW